MASATKQDYYEVALRLLAEGGAGRVTIANLCARLGITKGSFYHHFDNATAFLHAALDDWAARALGDVTGAADEGGGPAERLELLRLMAAGLDHEAESAIRALARTDAHAAAVQARVDEARRQVTEQTYVDAGVPRPAAIRFSRIGIAILIGAEQQGRPVDRELLAEVFDDFRSLVAHQYPRLVPPPPPA